MDVEKTVKKITKEYDKKVASDMRRAAIEQAAKTGLQKLRTAEKISSMTGMTTAEVLLSNLLELYPDGAIPAEEAKALIVPALKHNYDYVSPIVEEAHQQINKEAGIGLKPVVPEFDRDRADGIAANLAKAENIAEHAEAFQQQVENQSRNIVDASIRENAKAHTRAGLDVKVIRKYDGRGLRNGKIPCAWCLERDGEWSYGDAMARGIFQRHPGCGCEILYRSQKGWERQTNWEYNEWEEVQDKRKSYGLDATYKGDALKKEQIEIIKKYGSLENLMLNGSNDDLMRWSELSKRTGLTEKDIFAELSKNTDTWMDLLRLQSEEKMQRFTDQLLDTATDAELSALRMWSGETFVNINRYERWGILVDEISKNAAKNIENVLSRITTPEEIIVRRGTGTRHIFEKMPKGWEKDPFLLVGKTFEDKGFTATSPFEKGGFGGTGKNQAELIIRVPEGTHGAYIESVAHADLEKEFLLQKGYTYRIIKAEYVYDNPYFPEEGRLRVYTEILLND